MTASRGVGGRDQGHVRVLHARRRKPAQSLGHEGHLREPATRAALWDTRHHRLELSTGERAGGTGGLVGTGRHLGERQHATRGSPSKRGRFILERLLCKAPPPPPNNVATKIDGVDTSLTMRERLAQHRTNPACAGCHAEMDPIGLSFEHFDAVGAWRADDDGHAIDTADDLPDGRNFANAEELGAVLKADPALSACSPNSCSLTPWDALPRATKSASSKGFRATSQRKARPSNRWRWEWR